MFSVCGRHQPPTTFKPKLSARTHKTGTRHDGKWAPRKKPDDDRAETGSLCWCIIIKMQHVIHMCGVCCIHIIFFGGVRCDTGRALRTCTLGFSTAAAAHRQNRFESFTQILWRKHRIKCLRQLVRRRDGGDVSTLGEWCVCTYVFNRPDVDNYVVVACLASDFPFGVCASAKWQACGRFIAAAGFFSLLTSHTHSHPNTPEETGQCNVNVCVCATAHDSKNAQDLFRVLVSLVVLWRCICVCVCTVDADAGMRRICI